MNGSDVGPKRLVTDTDLSIHDESALKLPNVHDDTSRAQSRAVEDLPSARASRIGGAGRAGDVLAILAEVVRSSWLRVLALAGARSRIAVRRRLAIGGDAVLWWHRAVEDLPATRPVDLEACGARDRPIATYVVRREGPRTALGLGACRASALEDLPATAIFMLHARRSGDAAIRARVVGSEDLQLRAG